MKKLLALILAVVMVFAFAACGSGNDNSNDSNTESNTEATTETTQKAESTEDTAVADTSVGKAVDGTIELSTADMVIVINGTAVARPYIFDDILAAGITGNDYLKDIELYAGDYFSPNIFIDEEEDYIITPAYYNDSEETILMADATANEITMSTYSSTPEDKNVSILGIKFGMTKAEVLDMFGEPTWNDDESCQWLVTVSDADMEGNLMIYFTSDADDAAVNQVTLSVRESW